MMNKRSTTLFALLLAACGPGESSGDDTGVTAADDSSGAGQSTVGQMSTSGPGTTSTSPATSSSGADSTDEGTTFIDTAGGCEETGSGGATVECDLFAQDCCEGEKCMPWSNDGGPTWNATRCSPIDPRGAAAGEPCTVTGSRVSGIDSCDATSMCWNVDDATLMGTCRSFCAGDPSAPVCGDDEVCLISGEGIPVLCMPTCDPLGDDCGDELCVPNNEDFFCVGAAGGAAVGEACDFPNGCVEGAACVDPAAVPDCSMTGLGCCASWCDLMDADPDAGCAMGTTCQPWFLAPPPKEWAHVGVCVVPGSGR